MKILQKNIKPVNRIRAMAMWLAAWQVLIFILGIWWGSLLIKQSKEISVLERKLGMSEFQSESQVMKTQRMLFWEASTFFILVIGSMSFLTFIVIRDLNRSRSIQAFFASFTHELRTPLTSIRLQAESLQDAYGENELIERLLEDTTRLEAQVDKTLELARVEGGGNLNVQSIGLKSFLERTINQYKKYLGHSVQFNIKSERSLSEVQVLADPIALQIIFKNIIENSVRHSKIGDIKIDLTIKSNEQNVQLEFKDNGRGYSGDIEKLGSIFTKGKDSSGAGVGLYLIRELTQKMNGQISFESSSNGFVTRINFKS